MEQTTSVKTLDLSDEYSRAGHVARTAKVNIDDTRFTVDGVIAEMIIEVDEVNDGSEHSPSKGILAGCTQLNMDHSFYTAKSASPAELLKAQFVHTLGLSSASADPSDTSTASECDLRRDEVKKNKLPIKVHHLKKKGSRGRCKSSFSPKRHAKKKELLRRSVKDKANIESSQEKKIDMNIQPVVVLRKLAMYVGVKSEDAYSVSSSGDPVVKLGSICETRNRIKWSERKNLQILFEILYGETAPDDIDNVRYQVFGFCGFSFKKRSPEFLKRKKSLARQPIMVLRDICFMLGMKLSSKSEMVENIMTFLLSPTKVLDPSIDSAYQPCVLLKNLDAESVAKICEKLKSSQKRGKKKPLELQQPVSMSKKHTQISSEKKAFGISVKSLKQSSLQTEAKNPTSRVGAHRLTRGKKHTSVTNSQLVMPDISAERKLKPVGDEKQDTVPKASNVNAFAHPETSKRKRGRPRKHLLEPDKENLVKADSEKKVKTESSDGSRKRSSDIQRRTPEKRRKPSHYGDWLNEETSEVLLAEEVTRVLSELGRKSLESDEIAVEDPIPTEKFESKSPEVEDSISSEMQSDSDSEETTTDSDSEKTTTSSEKGVLSLEEDAEQDISPTVISPDVAIVKQEVKAKGVRLGSFPQIVRSIDSVTNCILQRLHVILFGTSLEPEQMKRNILNFEGFPFDKDSGEWEQKHFFLSLSASNNLLEVFEVLHIRTVSESPSALVDNLMNFLLCPQKELLDESSFPTEETKSSNNSKDKGVKKNDKQPVKKKPAVEVKKAAESKKPVQKKLTKKEEIKSKSRRKVLMDEATVRKLEMELAREQRARRRASMQVTNFLHPDSSPEQMNYSVPTVSSRYDQLGLIVKNDTQPVKPFVQPSHQPNQRCKLGDNAHVKFMVVTLNYADLDVLHHVIFLRSAVKSKVRRNILEFCGFDFDESTPGYHVRKTVLCRLGFQRIRRLAFILGIRPFEMDDNVDILADLIMRFLLQPSKMTQVPVKEYPQNFLLHEPGEFDKKTVFSNIPKLSEVLLQESGGPTASGGLIVKSISDLKLKGAQGKAMSLSDKAIPVAEVVTSDTVKINGVPNSTNTKPNLQKTSQYVKPRSILPIASKATPQNVRFHIVPSTSDSGAGSKVRVVSSSVPAQILIPTTSPAQTARKNNDVSHSQKTSNCVPLLINQAKLPPGQAFLLDPSQLLVMSKGAGSNQVTSSPVIKSSSSASVSKVPSTVHFPLITKLKVQGEAVQSTTPQKQKADVVKPVVTSSMKSSQVLQTLVIAKPRSSSQQQPLLIQKQASTTNVPSDLQKPLPSVKSKSVLGQPQQQQLFLLQKPAGQPQIHGLVQLQKLPNQQSNKSNTREGPQKSLIVQSPEGQKTFLVSPSSSSSSHSLNISSAQKIITSSVSQPQTIILHNLPPNSNGPPRLIQTEPSPLASTNTSQTFDLAKRLLSLPQIQTINASKSNVAEELVFHKKKPNGEEEKITFLKLPPGHPLLPAIESGQLIHPLKVVPMQSAVNSAINSTASTQIPAAPTVLSLNSKASENTTLCESGYKAPFSTGIVGQGTLQRNDVIQNMDHEDEPVKGDVNPSDDMLFERIRDIIHAANLEDLTLKKINEKLLAEFPLMELNIRRHYIKATVKNIICGMPSSS